MCCSSGLIQHVVFKKCCHELCQELYLDRPPIPFFMKDDSANSLGGIQEQINNIGRNYSVSVPMKIYLTQRCKPTNLISHKGVSTSTQKAAWQPHKQNSGSIEEHRLEMSKLVLSCLLHLNNFQLGFDPQERIKIARSL